MLKTDSAVAVLAYCSKDQSQLCVALISCSMLPNITHVLREVLQHSTRSICEVWWYVAG
jgi:hypothetical protein